MTSLNSQQLFLKSQFRLFVILLQLGLEYNIAHGNFYPSAHPMGHGPDISGMVNLTVTLFAR